MWQYEFFLTQCICYLLIKVRCEPRKNWYWQTWSMKMGKIDLFCIFLTICVWLDIKLVESETNETQNDRYIHSYSKLHDTKYIIKECYLKARYVNGFYAFLYLDSWSKCIFDQRRLNMVQDFWRCAILVRQLKFVQLKTLRWWWVSTVVAYGKHVFKYKSRTLLAK